MTLKERARKLKQDVPAVFLALKGRDTPLLAKILAGVTVAYAATGDESIKEKAIANAIPEFMRFNIVESEVRDVC